MTLSRKAPPKRRPLRPSSVPLARRSGVKARNAERKPKDWRRAYGSPERVAFINRMPCAQCARTGYTVNAHSANGGMGRKASYLTVIPLCQTGISSGCHVAQHRHGWSALPKLATREQRAKVAANVQRLWRTYLTEGPNG